MIAAASSSDSDQLNPHSRQGSPYRSLAQSLMAASLPQVDAFEVPRRGTGVSVSAVILGRHATTRNKRNSTSTLRPSLVLRDGSGPRSAADQPEDRAARRRLVPAL